MSTLPVSDQSGNEAPNGQSGTSPDTGAMAMANQTQDKVKDKDKAAAQLQPQADANSSDSGVPTNIEQVLQMAQVEQAKLAQERMQAEAKAAIQKKSEQDRAASVKDLQTKLADIDKLIGDYQKAFGANKSKSDTLTIRCQTMLENIGNSILQVDRDAVDKAVSDYNSETEKLKGAIDTLEKPPAVQASDQPPTSIADAAAKVQAATAKQQVMDQNYKNSFQLPKNVDDKLKELGSLADSLQSALEADPKDKSNYFRATVLDTGLKELLPMMIGPDELKGNLMQALTELGNAQFQLLAAQLSQSEFVADDTQMQARLADRQQRRVDNIVGQIKALPTS